MNNISIIFRELWERVQQIECIDSCTQQSFDDLIEYIDSENLLSMYQVFNTTQFYNFRDYLDDELMETALDELYNMMDDIDFSSEGLITDERWIQIDLLKRKFLEEVNWREETYARS